MTDSGIYLHFPFCSGKCNYCDFYSAEFNSEIKQEYVAALLKQIELCGARLHLHPDTLYLGGGTPTVLSAELLKKTILCAKKVFGDFSEITVEANPADDLAETFKVLKEVGVNRISLGIQSADETELKTLGRRHTVESAVKCVEDIKKAGIDNISVDCMIAVPGQTMQSLNKTIDFILSLSPKHVSAYLLKIEPNTPFGKADITTLNLPDDDKTAEMYLKVCERLGQNGFTHYEISNFCKPGYESKHNLKYWKLSQYLGIGPGAHSFVDGKRFFYPRDINAFIKDAKTVDDGVGGGEEEFIMLSLRLRSGLNYSEFSKLFGRDFYKENEQFIKKLQKEGLAEQRCDALALTDKGFLMSNSIISSLL